jgi:3',5'-cyclic AMP phosphodiesterase CpdA
MPSLFGALKGMNDAFVRLVDSEPVQAADLLLVTGDITDRGDLKAWAFFWQTLEQAGLKGRVRVVPGNHDVCCLGARLPGRGYEKADMARLMTGLEMGGQATKFPWVESPDPRLALFGLNSNNLGNFSGLTNAMGEIGYYQLKSFASHLHRYRDVPVKLVMMHHSPNIPEKETAIKRGQRPVGMAERLAHQLPQSQRQALNLLCISHKVRLLLHGHLHVHEDRRITGVRYVGAVASTEPHLGPGGPYLQFPLYTISAGSHRVSVRHALVPLK